MISKTILVGLVAISFVAGSIMTGTLVYGAPTVNPLIAINAAIADLQARMTAVETVNTNQNTAISAIQTLNTNQQTQIDALSASAGKSKIFATNLDLVPITAIDGGTYIDPAHLNLLFFGDTICGVKPASGAFAEGVTLYIAFGGNTLVEHDAGCLGAGDLDLNGDVDANFKARDVIVLQVKTTATTKWVEVAREQAP
ncbi:MAG: hypothetical protein HW410_1323 [Nitrosarchaeum sp.]|nr:hypothetical protein [Nitrosarchaeum sp.]